MFVILKLQLATLIILSGISYFLVDFQAALSLTLGCLCYIVPTVISVLILRFFRPYPKYISSGFIFAEILKIILALVLMVMMFLLYQGLQFLPFLLGLLSVSHFIFLYILKVDKYGK